MKRFEFSLEGLLRVRNVETEKLRGGLQKCVADLVEANEELERIAAEREGQFLQLRGRDTGALCMDDVRAHQRYLNLLHWQEAAVQERLVEFEAALKDAQQRYGEARRKQMVVERLRERHYEEYLEEWRRNDVKEMDEVAQSLRRVHVPEGAGR